LPTSSFFTPPLPGSFVRSAVLLIFFFRPNLYAFCAWFFSVNPLRSRPFFFQPVHPFPFPFSLNCDFLSPRGEGWFNEGFATKQDCLDPLRAVSLIPAYGRFSLLHLSSPTSSGWLSSNYVDFFYRPVLTSQSLISGSPLRNFF